MITWTQFRLSLFGILFLATSCWAAPNQEEWRQYDADSARSRYLPTSITPPLNVTWKIKIPYDLEPCLGHGDLIYLSGANLKPDQGTKEELWAVRAMDGMVLWKTSGGSGPPIATSRGIALYDYRLGAVRLVSFLDGTNLYTHNLYEGLPSSWVSRIQEEHPLLEMSNGNLLLTASSYTSQIKPCPTYKVIDAYFEELEGNQGKVTARRTLRANDGRGHDSYLSIEPLQPTLVIEVPNSRNWIVLQTDEYMAELVGGLNGTLYGPQRLGKDAGPIAAGNNRVFMEGAHQVLAFDKHGKILWDTLLESNIADEHASANLTNGRVSEADPTMIVTPSRVIVMFFGKLYALDQRTGRVLWKTNKIGEVKAPGVAVGNIIYALSNSNATEYRYPPSDLDPFDSVTAFSVKTGKRLWSKQVGHYLQRVIAHHGSLYVTDIVEMTSGYDSTYVMLKLDPVAGRSKMGHLR